MPPATSASAFFSSSSMICLNLSAGWAPTKRRPLMKKCGVPLAWRSSARSWSTTMSAECFFSAMASLTLASSRPSSFA
jgi:hypothetical protein